MRYQDRPLFDERDIPQDAFFRMRCYGCGKAPVYLRNNRKLECGSGCGWSSTERVLVWTATYNHCYVCSSVCVRVSSRHPRCVSCQVKWEADGRPMQVVKTYTPLAQAVDWHTVPLIDVNRAVETTLAIRGMDKDSSAPATEDAEEKP